MDMLDKLYAALSSKKNRDILTYLSDGKERTLKEIYKSLKLDTYPSREIDKLVLLQLLEDRKHGKERYVAITHKGLELLGILSEVKRLYEKGENTLLSTKNAPQMLKENIMKIHDIIKTRGRINYEEILEIASKSGLGRFEVDHALNKMLIYRDIIKIGDEFATNA